MISNIKKIFRRLVLKHRFIKDFFEFKRLASGNDKRFIPLWKNIFPRLYENTEQTKFDSHYIFHPAWAARIIAKLKPKIHVDISSTLNFCSIISAFVPVDFYDYRPAKLNLSGLNSKKGDLMNLPFADNSVESISCMHTVEHVGLGRYGDPIDPDGDLKAIKELKRVTAHNGTLIFVTPVGKQKIMFNAHRIYDYERIISYFEGFELKEFALIPDNADTVGILVNPEKVLVNKQNYGCGCFWFVKK